MRTFMVKYFKQLHGFAKRLPVRFALLFQIKIYFLENLQMFFV